jgi:hypothetical protein
LVPILGRPLSLVRPSMRVSVIFMALYASVPLGGWFDDDVRPLRDCRERRPNRHYRIESVHESAWY